MAYRNKTYVCFDADTDMWSYKYMIGWKNNDKIDFDFHNAHDIHSLRIGSTEATIKLRLRERMKNSKLLLVLIGEKTKNLFRFVRWEMEIAIGMGIPIVAVYLNGSRDIDEKVCPAILKNTLALHIPFKQAAIKWAIDKWPLEHASLKRLGTHGGRIISNSVYKELGI